MARALTACAVGIVVAGLIGACGEPSPSPSVDAAVRSRPGPPTIASPVVAWPAGSPVASPIRATPATPAALVLVPTVDAATDPIAQLALAEARRDGMIRSGTPVVRLSRDVTPEELAALGFGTWNFTPTCVPPLRLVILQGNLAWGHAFPVVAEPGTEIPLKFLIFIYDARLGAFRWIGGDPNGAWVRKALGDPSLPDIDPATLPNEKHPFQIPCTPTILPGG